jgi:hypothetical protein
MHSIIGFTFTMILGALAIEVIQRNRKYIVKAFFYYLCGMSYIYACLMFSVTVYFLMFSRFVNNSAIAFFHVISLFCVSFTAWTIKIHLDGWLDD